jgi:hypothetical protein
LTVTADRRYISAAMSAEPRIYVNVTVGQSDTDRIEREERFWTGTRLSILCAVAILLVLAFLYFIASQKSETYWPDWMIPAGIEPQLGE